MTEETVEKIQELFQEIADDAVEGACETDAQCLSRIQHQITTTAQKIKQLLP